MMGAHLEFKCSLMPASYQHFSLSQNVLRRLHLHDSQKSSLCGKGLIVYHADRSITKSGIAESGIRHISHQQE